MIILEAHVGKEHRYTKPSGRNTVLWSSQPLYLRNGIHLRPLRSVFVTIWHDLDQLD